jgi:hypothetical protein
MEDRDQRASDERGEERPGPAPSQAGLVVDCAIAVVPQGVLRVTLPGERRQSRAYQSS